MDPQPRKPSIRIIDYSPTRGSHQKFWPEVEAVKLVTVVKRFDWGTDSVTYECVARRVVDVRNGHTIEALEEAQRVASHAADCLAATVQGDNPYPA